MSDEPTKISRWTWRRGGGGVACASARYGSGSERGGDSGDEPLDEMYDAAVRVVTESGKASISYVQRRLQVGYNRAARMVEQMEREGVVSAADHRGVREVLARDLEE